MKRLLFFALLSALIIIIIVSSCTHKPNVKVVPEDGNYPDSVAKIITTKCINAGCHNQASAINAGELALDTWDHLFKGGVSGAVAVPYSVAYSPMLYYVCPDESLGTKVNDPAHVFTPLTTAEYKTLASWIAKGAPDKNGKIPFASDPATRQKIYIAVAGCNLIAVVDAASRQIMRYIPVGNYPGNEAIHDLEVSADGKYAYFTLFGGNLFQKIDCTTDTVVGTTDLAPRTLGGSGGDWSVLSLSPGDTAAMITSYLNSGAIETINTATMKVNTRMCADFFTVGTSSGLVYPHGICSNATFDTFFVALQKGNVIDRLTFNCLTGFCPQYISVNSNPASISSSATTPDPHQVQMAPDYSKYYVTCQNTNEVRVMNAHTNALIKTIPVGYYPQEMTICQSKNYLLVSCMLDSLNSSPNRLGTVYVIDYTTDAVVKILKGDFYEPHDITIDNQNSLIWIASRNNYNGGVPAHHSTSCGGNAGWYTIFNLNTLAPADNKRYEVGKDPYSISARFK